MAERALLTEALVAAAPQQMAQTLAEQEPRVTAGLAVQYLLQGHLLPMLAAAEAAAILLAQVELAAAEKEEAAELMPLLELQIQAAAEAVVLAAV